MRILVVFQQYLNWPRDERKMRIDIPYLIASLKQRKGTKRFFFFLFLPLVYNVMFNQEFLLIP
jgi:hypothetical protein